jgi:hypothetical protein
MNVIHPGSPALRVRYRQGVLIDPYGFPDWLLYARALVELPPPVAELTADEQRVWDVLAANRAMLGGDPLWPAEPDPDGGAVGTPAGWCWAHLPAIEGAAEGATGDGARRVALVPVELHGSYRHAGGVRVLPLDWQRRGVRSDDPAVPVGPADGTEVPDEVLDDLEELLGYALPPAYRRYLSRTNGAGPTEPGVLSGPGLVADQPLFGLARSDRQQDLSYAADWFADRLAPDLLGIGYVQGGLLAVRVTGEDADSIWYFDDDDPRDDDAFDPDYLRDHLLYRCADSIDAFWSALRRPALVLLDFAAEMVAAGQARAVHHELAGAGLPAALRAPWQPPARRGNSLTNLFDAG